MAVELVGWGAAEAQPLEIGEGAPLELKGEWVGTDLVSLWFASSFGRGRGVGVWRLVGYL